MSARPPSPAMSPPLKPATAHLQAGPADADTVMMVGGDWRLSDPVPAWAAVPGASAASPVRVVPEALGKWDTSLVLFLLHGRAWCAEAHREFQVEALPENLQALLQQVTAAGSRPPATPEIVRSRWARAVEAAKKWAANGLEAVTFIGECTLGFLAAAPRPRRFRWLDCLVEMQQCWASSLPIVSLVSFLVGVILAFQAAVQLREFGAAIFVADLVGLAVVREMGPMMAAVIVAGGTGAGFAAHLGNVKVAEEIDALETLGISAVDFLALPRVLAVTLMLPVLALYANILGILGGMFVAATMLDIPAAAYWIETQDRVGLSDVTGGVIKSVCVGLAGCLRGMKCDRSAAGVGAATSSAVVTGILLIVLIDALFALIFNVLGV